MGVILECPPSGIVPASGSTSLLSDFGSKQGSQLLRGKILELASLQFQAKANQGGSNPARAGERLLRHDHLGGAFRVWLPRGQACRAEAGLPRVERLCSSRDTYRFPLQDQTAPSPRFDPGCDTRPATVL